MVQPVDKHAMFCVFQPLHLFGKAGLCHVNSCLNQTKWTQISISALFSPPPKPNERSWNRPQTPPAPSIKKIYKQLSQVSKSVGRLQIAYHCLVRMRLKMTFHLGTYSSCTSKLGLTSMADSPQIPPHRLLPGRSDTQGQCFR